MSFDLGLGSIYLLFVICFCFFLLYSGHECSTSSMVRGAGGQGQNHDNDEESFTSQRGGLIFAFNVLYS